MIEIIKVEPRVYKCTCCGHHKKISTNHRVSCFDHCEGCSWKAFYKGEENSICTPLHRHCRKFEYVTDEAPYPWCSELDKCCKRGSCIKDPNCGN